MKIKVQALSTTVDLDVEPTETVKGVKANLQASLGFPEEEMRLSNGSQILADNAATMDIAGITDGTELCVARMQEWNDARLESLKELFMKHGEVHAGPCTSDDRPLLTHDSDLPSGLELPAPLQRLLRAGGKWNFEKDSDDIFHCNILVDRDTLCIFGDEDCKKEWLEEHGADCCAGDDWALVCVTSEYDYFFVNIRKDSPQFGATRHIVNNCDEDVKFTDPPFERFLDVVESYAKVNADKDDPDDFDSFLQFGSSKRRRTSDAEDDESED